MWLRPSPSKSLIACIVRQPERAWIQNHRWSSPRPYNEIGGALSSLCGCCLSHLTTQIGSQLAWLSESFNFIVSLPLWLQSSSSNPHDTSSLYDCYLSWRAMRPNWAQLRRFTKVRLGWTLHYLVMGIRTSRIGEQTTPQLQRRFVIGHCSFSYKIST